MPPQMVDVGVRLQVKGPYNLNPVVRNLKSQIDSSMGNGFGASMNRNVTGMTTNLKGLGASLGDVRRQAQQTNAELSRMGGNVSGPGIDKLHKELSTTVKQLNSVQDKLGSTRSEFRRFGAEAAASLRRYGAFAVSVVALGKLKNALRDAFSESLKFQRSMVQLQQMGVSGARDIKLISDNITELSKSLGASSIELAEVSKYLKGAGMSVTEVNEALKVLARTSLSPTFKDLRSTQEGLLSIRSQFKLTAKEYEAAFDSINAVAQNFAAESEDTIAAIKRAGAAFAASSGQLAAPKDQLNELIALFTAVRSTTRESADTIGTAFRTIFARLQSNAVVNDLRQMGVELRYTSEEAKALGKNVEGQFVGAYTAIERLHNAMKNVPTTDPRFASIVERIGGQRQLSKVLPLIQQFPMAQKALATAQTSQNSVARDAAKAQDAYLTKLTKVKEEFAELFRVVTQSKTFQSMVDGFTAAASAAAKFGRALEPIFPLIAAIGTIKLGQAFLSTAAGFSNFLKSGGRRVRGFSTGGVVPGEGNHDNVPALLTPNEYVLNKKAAASAGYGKLSSFNKNPDQYKIVAKYGNDRDENLGGLHAQLAKAIKAKGGMTAMYADRFAGGGRVKKKPDVIASLSPSDVKNAFKNVGINFDPSKLATGVNYMTPESVAKNVGGAADAFFNPGNRKIGINAKTNRDVLQLLGHEFAHAMSTSAGTMLGVGDTATRAKGTIFSSLANVGRKEFFGKKQGLFRGSIEDHYRKNLGVTDEDDLNEEGFAHLFEQYVMSKQRQAANQKPLKSHTSPDVLRAFSTIENQLLPAVGAIGRGRGSGRRIAASSSPMTPEEELAALIAEQSADMKSSSAVTGGGKTSIKAARFGAVEADAGYSVTGSQMETMAELRDRGYFGTTSHEAMRKTPIEIAAEASEKAFQGLADKGKRRKIGSSTGAPRAFGEAKLKDFSPETTARAEPTPIPLAEGSAYTDMLGNAFNFEHPNARVQSGLQTLAKHRGMGGDILGTKEAILAGIQSGTYNLPALQPGESSGAIQAVKALADEAGFELSGRKQEFKRDKATGGYIGNFQKKMSTEELFEAAKAESGLKKYGSLDELRSAIKERKGSKFLMGHDIKPIKERLMRKVASEEGVPIQIMKNMTKGLRDFDPEDTNFGQQVATVKKAKQAKAIETGTTNVPALRATKHQFINDFLKDKTFRSYDEKVAAAKQAKDLYEGMSNSEDRMFKQGGSGGGGRRRGRPPGSGGGGGGGGGGDNPKIVSILEKILNEVKGISGKMGKGGGGSGNNGSSKVAASRVVKPKRSRTVDTTATVRDMSALGYTPSQVRHGFGQSERPLPTYTNNNNGTNDPFFIPFMDEVGEPYRNAYDLADEVAITPNFESPIRNPQRGPYQEFGGGPFVNVKRYVVNKDFDVKVRRGLEYRKHSDPTKRIKGRNSSGRLEKARQLREQRAISRFDADDFVSKFAPIDIPLSTDDEYIDPSNDFEIGRRIQPEVAAMEANKFLAGGYDLDSPKRKPGRFSRLASRLNRPVLSGMIGKVGKLSDKVGGFASGIISKHSPDGKLSGLATAGLATASAFAPQIIEQYTGSVEKPGRYGVGGARIGAGVGGAIQYGGLGASLGSALGPVGTVFGGMTGAALGFVNAIKEADDKLRELDFQKDFDKMTNALEGVISGKMKLGGQAIGDVNRGLNRVNVEAAIKGSNAMGITGALGEYFGLLDGKTNRATEQATRSEALREKLVPIAPQLQEFGGQIAKSLRLTPEELGAGGKEGRLAKFRQSGGKNIAENISVATDTSLNNVYESFDKMIIEADKERKARIANTKVIEEQTVQIQQFGLIADAVKSAADSLNTLQSTADALQSAFSGNLQAISTRSISNDARIGNLDSKSFDFAVKNITDSLGDNRLSAGLGQTASGLNKAAVSLPDIISRANAAGGIEDEGLVNRIQEGMQAQGIPELIRDKLSSVLDSIDPEELGKSAKENVQKLTDELIEKGFANVNNVLESAAKQLEERANAFNQGLIANEEMISKVGEAYSKRARLEITARQSAAKVGAAITGNSSVGNLSLDTLNSPFKIQQEFLTGMKGRDAMSPQAIGDRLRSTQAQILDTKNARDNSTGKEQEGLSEQLANLQGNAQRLGQALENLADTSERNAIIQEKINKLEEDRQGRLSFTEKLLTADPKTLREMNRNAQLSDVAAQQGNFVGFNAKQIGGVLEHLASLGNARLPGYNNAAASDVRERLLLNSGIGVGTIDPRNEKMRIGLMGQQANNDRIAVDAQDQIANNQSGLQQQFFAELKQIQQQFFDKLRANLAEAEKRDVTTQQGIVSGKQRELTNASESLAKLQMGGFSLEDSRMLNSNENIGNLNDAIMRRQGLAGGISALKNQFAEKSIGGATANGSLTVNQENAISSRASELLKMSHDDASQKITVPIRAKIKALGGKATNKDVVRQTINSFLDDFQRSEDVSLGNKAGKLSGDISKQVFGADSPENRAKAMRFAEGKKDYSKLVGSLEPFADEQSLVSQQAVTSRRAEKLNAQAAALEGATTPKQTSPVLPPAVVSEPAIQSGVSIPDRVKKQIRRHEIMGQSNAAEALRQKFNGTAQPEAAGPNVPKSVMNQLAKYKVTGQEKAAAKLREQYGLDKPANADAAEQKRLERRRRAGNMFTPPPQIEQKKMSGVTAEGGNDQQAVGQHVQNLGSVINGLNQAMTTMGTTITRFGKMIESFNMPDKIQLERNGKIEVVFNGTDFMKKLNSDFAESVTKEVLAAVEQKLPKMMSNLPA